jgi:hypothetical protein
MAGLGRRTFAPGEVLTASNVMNYLQDQAVMNFAGTAARGSAIGTAVSEGMVSYLADSNDVEVYDGSAWSPLAFESYANSRSGLVPIIAPTVNYSGGTATANALGEISFSAVTAISLNNVFTSTYKNYRINVNLTSIGGSNGSFCFRLRSSGADRTGSEYLTSGIQMAATGTNGAFFATTTFFDMSFAYSSGTSFSHLKIEVADPVAAIRTKATATTNGLNSAGQAASWQTALLHNVDQSQDGFSIFGNGSSQTLTGTLQVFGYYS